MNRQFMEEARKIGKSWEQPESYDDVLDFIGDSKYVLLGEMSHASIGLDPKIIIWAHSSHLGDARATDMGDMGELNLGQLVRERYGDASISIGFSTYSGTVTAASEWDGPAQRKRVRPSLPESYEAQFHELDQPGILFLLRDNTSRLPEFAKRRLQRAIGVIYLPRSERMSHYFHAVLPKQFDAMIHIDHTHAVEPLELTPEWTRGELPETFPRGL